MKQRAKMGQDSPAAILSARISSGMKSLYPSSHGLLYTDESPKQTGKSLSQG